MYRVPLVRLALVREGTVTAKTRTIRTPADAAAIARETIGDADREHVIALLLDIRHRVVAVHTVSVGFVDSAPVHAREVFKAAILINATAVILAHNHPSGDLGRSRADEAIARRITKAGELLGIPVLDHIIVTSEDFLSLRTVGAMDAPGSAQP